MTRIKDAGKTVMEYDVSAIERDVGVRLPEDYRRFVLKYNGGRPIPHTIKVPELPGSPTDVNILFGVSRDEKTSNIGWNLDALGDVLPKGCIPIACDSGGNLFCLALWGDGPHPVVYIDMEGDGMLYSVAASFSEFIDSLY